jgi:hypothetical protein
MGDRHVMQSEESESGRVGGVGDDGTTELILRLPRAHETFVMAHESDREFVCIEQPDPFGGNTDVVMIHESQVDALIGALQRFLASR